MKEFELHPPIKINYTHPLVLRLEDVRKDDSEPLLWEKVHKLEEELSDPQADEQTILNQYLNYLSTHYTKTNYWSKKIIDIIKNYLKGD